MLKFFSIVAAVNYHFGDKEKLYLTVIKYWADESFKNYPLDFIMDTNQDSKERLKAFIYETLICLLGENGQGTGFGRLIAMEASLSPSDVVREVVSESIKKPTQALFQIIEDMTGIKDKKVIKEKAACIVGETVYFYLSRFLIDELFDIKKTENINDIQYLSNIIFDFSLNSLLNNQQK